MLGCVRSSEVLLVSRKNKSRSQREEEQSCGLKDRPDFGGAKSKSESQLEDNHVLSP